MEYKEIWNNEWRWIQSNSQVWVQITIGTNIQEHQKV